MSAAIHLVRSGTALQHTRSWVWYFGFVWIGEGCGYACRVAWGVCDACFHGRCDGFGDPGAFGRRLARGSVGERCPLRPGACPIAAVAADFPLCPGVLHPPGVLPNSPRPGRAPSPDLAARAPWRPACGPAFAVASGGVFRGDGERGRNDKSPASFHWAGLLWMGS